MEGYLYDRSISVAGEVVSIRWVNPSILPCDSGDSLIMEIELSDGNLYSLYIESDSDQWSLSHIESPDGPTGSVDIDASHTTKFSDFSPFAQAFFRLLLSTDL